jgi:hypothetical protein
MREVQRKDLTRYAVLSQIFVTFLFRHRNASLCGLCPLFDD